MSKTRGKKSRKRAKGGDVDSTSAGVRVATNSPIVSGPSVSVWYATKSEERSQNLNALKLELLGPFLFGQTCICQQALTKWRSLNLLVEGQLPVFFKREDWDTVRLITAVVQSTLGLCETNKQFSECMFNTTSKSTQDSTMADLVYRHSDALRVVPSPRVMEVFSALKIHVTNFAARAQDSNLGELFSQTLVSKEKLVAPVKDRGNTNFKLSRFKAAIGDYTTAIKLCPYNPVLYCNRALCYLRNEEYWCACVDSYRAVVLKPGWEKAYYRCAEAWCKLGEPTMALIINTEGIEECKDIGDLSKQTTDLKTSKTVNEPVNTEVKGQADVSNDNKKSLKSEAKTKTSKRDKKSAHTKKVEEKILEEPFDKFESLNCPQVDDHLTCKALRKLCNKVKLRYLSPASYFTPSREWESLDTAPFDPPSLNTDVTTITEPMDTGFDEIWCPLLVESAEREGLDPPQVHYLSESTVLKSKLRQQRH